MGYFEDLREQKNVTPETGRTNIGFRSMDERSAGALDSNFYRIEQYTLDATDMGRAHEDVSFAEDGTRVTNLVLDSGDVVASAYEKTTKTEGGTSVDIRVEFSDGYTIYDSLDERRSHEQDPNEYEIVRNFDGEGNMMFERIENEGSGYGNYLSIEYEEDGSRTEATYHCEFMDEQYKATDYDADGNVAFEYTRDVKYDEPLNDIALSDVMTTIDEHSITYKIDENGDANPTESSSRHTEVMPVSEIGETVTETNYKDGIKTDSIVKVRNPDGNLMLVIEKTYDKDGVESVTAYDGEDNIISTDEKEHGGWFEVKFSREELSIRGLDACPAFSGQQDGRVFSGSSVYDSDGNIRRFDITVSNKDGSVAFTRRYDSDAAYLSGGSRISSEFTEDIHTGELKTYDDKGVERERYFIDVEGGRQLEKYDSEGRLEYREYTNIDGEREEEEFVDNPRFEGDVENVVGGICGDMDSDNDVLPDTDDSDTVDTDMDTVDADTDGLSDFDGDNDTVD